MRNKVVKKILVVFILMMTFFQNVISVNAFTVTDTLKIDLVDDLGYIEGADVYLRKTTTGEYLYCLQANKGNPSTTVTLEGSVKDDGIIYLIKNGFPNVKMTGDDKKDFYITQLAIWWYNEDIHGVDSNKLDDIKSGKYDDNELVSYIKKLYNGAVSAYKNGIPEPSLSINSSDAELTLSSDGKYLLSDLMKVNLVGSTNYKVSIVNNENAIVIDKNGNSKSSFKANETFRIKVPNDDITELSIEVKVEADGVIDEVYSYKPTSDWQQKVSVGALVSTIVPLSKNITFNYKVNKVNVEFSKIDVTTGNELAGAHLEIRDSNNKLVEAWVSTNETHYFELLPGKYTLTEIISPEGYELSSETIEFEVKEDGSTTKVVMENKPIKKEIKVEFSKIDVSTGKELAGAHLEIRDSNNKLVETWVSTNETHYFELLPGVYTLTETIAPEGYELSTETIEFEVKEDGSTTKVVMENKPIKKEIKVEFSKIDVSTGKELAGAHLEIRDSNNKLVETWVSTNETHYFELLPGVYTLTETIAPEGYELSTETIEFEVKEDGSTTKIVMENKPYIEVPITSLNASSAVMILGSLLFSLGLIVVYSYVKKESVNE